MANQLDTQRKFELSRALELWGVVDRRPIR
jgi:hypothetical protein